MQCSALQYITVHYTVEYSEFHKSNVPYTLQCITVQIIAEQCCAVQCITVNYSTSFCSTVKFSEWQQLNRSIVGCEGIIKKGGEREDSDPPAM